MHVLILQRERVYFLLGWVTCALHLVGIFMSWLMQGVLTTPPKASQDGVLRMHTWSSTMTLCETDYGVSHDKSVTWKKSLWKVSRVAQASPKHLTINSLARVISLKTDHLKSYKHNLGIQSKHCQVIFWAQVGTVKPQCNDHLWYSNHWLLYRGDLLTG